MMGGDTSSGVIEQIGDAEVVPRTQLQQTGETDHGLTYQCPRCGYEWITEFCDCPECGWAGMCQPGFGGEECSI